MTIDLRPIEIDSEIFGLDVWDLVGAKSIDDFTEAIAILGNSKRQSYVSCKIPIKQISDIHAAERAGFEFVETQFRTVLGLRESHDTDKYPYDYIRVETEAELIAVQSIAESTIEHDRFSLDPMIGKNLSGTRYKKYLEQSFQRSDDEIWCVKSRSSGEILTFRSHRILSDKEVQLLIGGVHSNYKDVGLGVISSHYCFSHLKAAGYSRAVTHISAANLPIVNLEIGHFNFRVADTSVVLRAVVTPLLLTDK